ncbi:MAG: AbrB/MazE/SpoVT family DNA-binding domain-containing protein [Defluviitaleaceae bacterium]|nr:AbrB/MazE/SpoVT family DNA-binding domain-containing protein [Defluviitaleaceae bacterium]
MTATLKRWGNSTGVRLPKEAIEKSNLRLDDPLEVIVFQGGITLKRKDKKTFSDIAKPLINTKDWKFDREEANER